MAMAVALTINNSFIKFCLMPWHLAATIVPNAIRLCQMPSDCAKCHVKIVSNVNVSTNNFNIDFAQGLIYSNGFEL
jgi:hypothetical protein